MREKVSPAPIRVSRGAAFSAMISRVTRPSWLRLKLPLHPHPGRSKIALAIALARRTGVASLRTRVASNALVPVNALTPRVAARGVTAPPAPIDRSLNGVSLSVVVIARARKQIPLATAFTRRASSLKRLSVGEISSRRP